MNRFVFALLMLASASAGAEEWVTLSSDGSSRILLDAGSVERKPQGESSFRIKRIYGAQKDMMGLGYNATLSRYVLSCRTGEVLFRQQFLLQDDEVVWTFPESGKVQKASLELPDAVVGAICTPAADSSR